MGGSNSFVFSAKRRGSNTPVVCKFFSDQDSYRREMKFFERVHTGDFVPGDLSHHITTQLQPFMLPALAVSVNGAGIDRRTGSIESAVLLASAHQHTCLVFLQCTALFRS